MNRQKESYFHLLLVGIVSALFSTNHAIGITTDRGIGILIHIGMDTVQIDGEFFTSHTTQGSRVEKGQLLIEFDIGEIKAAGFAVTTPVVVTNHDQYNLVTTNEKQIKVGDWLMTITPTTSKEPSKNEFKSVQLNDMKMQLFL